MYLNQLKAFVAVYETGSFVKSAKLLFLTQPAVSQQIKKLENELGAELFHHAKGTAAATDCGKLFYPYAKRAVQAMEDASAAISSRKAANNELEVYSFWFGADDAVFRLINAFQKEHPEIHVKIKNLKSPNDGFPLFDMHGSALYFSEYDWCKNSGASFFKLYVTKCQCVMRRDSPFADKDSISLNEISAETMRFSAGKNPTAVSIRETIKSVFPSSQLVVHESYQAAFSNIALMGGVCVVPDYIPIPTGLTAVRLSPGFTFPVGFAYTGELTAPMSCFLDFAKEKIKNAAK